MPEGHGNDAERRRRRPHRTRMQDAPMISVAGKRAVCAGRGCAAPVFGPGVRLPCASGNKRKGSGTLEEQEILSALVLATSAAHRARGLLCADPNGDAMLLVPCHDIHTVGMGHRLDVAFVDRAGQVIEAHRAVGPLRRLRNARAEAVVERFASCEPWFRPGDRIGLACMSAAIREEHHEEGRPKAADRRPS